MLLCYVVAMPDSQAHCVCERQQSPAERSSGLASSFDLLMIRRGGSPALGGSPRGEVHRSLLIEDQQQPVLQFVHSPNEVPGSSGKIVRWRLVR